MLLVLLRSEVFVPLLDACRALIRAGIRHTCFVAGLCRHICNKPSIRDNIIGRMRKRERIYMVLTIRCVGLYKESHKTTQELQQKKLVEARS